ncbi:MAG: hypothetical protein Q8O09_01775 [Bacillota bacterium]|nr:hypothetical protein [Bacillota bacterium]
MWRKNVAIVAASIISAVFIAFIVINVIQNPDYFSITMIMWLAGGFGAFWLVAAALFSIISISIRNGKIYEQRLNIFHTAIDFMDACTTRELSSEDLRIFRSSVLDSSFFLSKKGYEYLNNLFNEGSKLKKAYAKLKDPVIPDPEKDEALKTRTEIQEWFKDQYLPLQRLFARYLGSGS